MPPNDTVTIEPAVEAPEKRPALTPKRILWPVLLSLSALAAVAIFTFDYGDYVEAVGSANLWLLSIAVGSVALRVILGGWRFRYISGGRLSLGQGIRGQLSWDFFSNVTPSAIGGGPLAIVYISKDARVRAGDVTAWTIFSMVLDQLWYIIIVPLVLIASLYMEVIPASLGRVGYGVFLGYLSALMVWVVVFAYATLYNPALLRRMTGWLFNFKPLRRFREAVLREMTQLERRAFILRSQPLRFYVGGLLLTVATWSMRYVLILFVVWGIYAPADKLLVFMRGAALTLASLGMPTPGGSGGIEGLYVLFFSGLIPTAAVAPTLLVWRLLGYYAFIAVGLVLTTRYLGRRLTS